MNTTPGRLRLQVLTAGDAPGLARLAEAEDCAAVVGLPLPRPGVPGTSAALEAVRSWLDHVNPERSAGRRHLLGVGDGRALGGVVGLEDIGAGEARLIAAVEPALRRRGIGRFAVEHILLHAFQSLRLDRITATTASPVARSFLAALGFHAAGALFNGVHAPECVLTRRGWQEHRNAPVLAALHPALRAILHRELAAGNEIVETGRGWPDADSVLVKLKREFSTPRESLPEGVGYQALNDPHWWMEEFSSVKPRHILAR